MSAMIVGFRSSSVALALSLGLALAGAPQASAQDKIEIKIGHITASDSFLMRRLLWPLRDALEKTGKVKVTLYGTGTPFSNPTRFSEMIEKGILDMAQGIPQFEAGRYPLNLLVGEPFIIPDTVKGAVAYNQLTKKIPELLKEFAPNRVLYASMSDGEHFHSAKVTVRSIDDIKGLRILGTNPGVQALMRDAGASVVALPSTSNYENLQKGVADAISASYVNIQAFNLLEVTSSHYELSTAAQPFYVAINSAKYASLPPDVKKVIDDFSTDQEAAQAAQTFADIARDQHQAAIAKGHVVLTATKSERDALRARFKHLTDARLQDLQKKGLPAEQFYSSLITMNQGN